MGTDAREVEQRFVQALRELRSASRWVSVNALHEAFLRCGKPGWDGEEAEPISAATFATARDFLSALPTTFPSPEVGPLEDGTITLDWFPDDDSIFTVVVFPDRKVAFASIASERRLRGIELMDEEVPDSILTELRRIY